MNKHFDEVLSHFRDNCDNKTLNFNFFVPLAHLLV